MSSMASGSSSILNFLSIYVYCSLLFFLSESQTQSLSKSHTAQKPNLLVLPVQQDAYTGLHWANIHKRTPLAQIPVLVDLNGNHLWVNCDQHYASSTYQAPFCHSTQCDRANSHLCHTCVSSSRPGCHNNTCGLMSANPVTQQIALGELAQDVLAMIAARGPNIGPMVFLPQFLFSCAPSFLVRKGLPNRVQGVAGLGHGPISLPNQLASHFGLQRQFTMCLSRYPTSNGVILFGDAQHNMHYSQSPNVFRDLAYTPLMVSPQGEYYIQITSIRINRQTVTMNPSMLLSYSMDGFGGTMVSTSTPYTVLHHTIFEAFNQVFAKQMPRQAQVKAVGPFGLCFNTKKMGNAAPSVDLVMDKPNVVWRISGENLMVQAQPGVSCLGFVNGGMHPKAAITIGARQLEENVVVFDLARSTLGFSNSFHSHGGKCGNLYHFTNP